MADKKNVVPTMNPQENLVATVKDGSFVLLNILDESCGKIVRWKQGEKVVRFWDEAVISMTKTNRNSDDSHESNVEAANNLSSAICDGGTKVVLFSSKTAYASERF